VYQAFAFNRSNFFFESENSFSWDVFMHYHRRPLVSHFIRTTWLDKYKEQIGLSMFAINAEVSYFSLYPPFQVIRSGAGELAHCKVIHILICFFLSARQTLVRFSLHMRYEWQTPICFLQNSLNWRQWWGFALASILTFVVFVLETRCLKLYDQ